jgi:hypothetical protein
MLKERAYVLEYMARFDINDIDGVGQLIDKYYNEKEKLFKVIRRKNTQWQIEEDRKNKNKKPEQIGSA